MWCHCEFFRFTGAGFIIKQTDYSDLNPPEAKSGKDGTVCLHQGLLLCVQAILEVDQQLSPVDNKSEIVPVSHLGWGIHQK